MNVHKTKAALRGGIITQWECHIILTAIANRRHWRTLRDGTIARMALWDGQEVSPGVWRPYTLDEIGRCFSLTRERVRQIIESFTPGNYPSVLRRRKTLVRLYRESLKAARRNRAHCIFTRGKNKGKTRPEYTAYRNMLQRVLNVRNPNYPGWGGRGVNVCREWLGKSGYQNFIKDMGRRPSRKHQTGRAVYSLHRINNELLYSKGTCKWATGSEQSRERRPKAKRSGACN
jgi:hypothetical protein